jgi:hypothetical protein
MKPSAWSFECRQWNDVWIAVISTVEPEHGDYARNIVPLYAVPPGYAVVPIEPTEKMKEAAMVTYIEAKLADWGMWKAMVAEAQEHKT